MSREPSEIQYQCVRCLKNVAYSELLSMPQSKCPNCGYRILKKVRAPVVKHVKAR
ncbi:MAG: DNA-directed RNA polymerase subunit P [Candidatus Bathyarchaeia archaeon]